MTYSQEKVDAYAQLEEAIENIRKVHFAEDGEQPNVLTGWVLLTSAIEFGEPCPDKDHDDLDVRSNSGWFTRRSQNPTFSYGMINEALRHYNDIQTNED